MPNTLTNLTLTDLAARVASADPTPGGGSMAALAGALGASLGTMVWRLTQAKGAGELSAERLSELSRELEDLAATLRENVEKDARSYEGVLLALRLPKEGEEERAARRGALEAATRAATEVPLDTARLCMVAMDRCLGAARSGYSGAVTDAGVGLLLAFAGLNGALYNVEINLAGLSDEVYRAAVTGEVAMLRERGAATMSSADVEVRDLLAGRN